MLNDMHIYNICIRGIIKRVKKRFQKTLYEQRYIYGQKTFQNILAQALCLASGWSSH